MNVWTELRENVVEALKALPALEDVTIAKIAEPRDVWGIAKGRAIGVCRAETVWAAQERAIGDFGPAPSTVSFAIVVKADSAVSSTSALEKPGLAEDLGLAVLGVRAANVAPAGLGEVHLYAARESLLVDPDRQPGGAGRVAQVLIFETTPICV